MPGGNPCGIPRKRRWTMTDVNEGMVLRGRGLDKWYGET